MRVKVDLDLCQGHGTCAEEAPEVFDLDAAEGKVILLQAEPAEALRDAVKTAVKYCPTRALTLED